MTIIEQIKQTVLHVEPEAQVYLFGSRARGDFRDDSDWDLLIVLPRKFDYHYKQRIIHNLNDIEIVNHEIFNVIVKESNFWLNDNMLHTTQIYQSIQKDKVLL
jgi:uncharacterized protein